MENQLLRAVIGVLDVAGAVVSPISAPTLMAFGGTGGIIFIGPGVVECFLLGIRFAVAMSSKETARGWLGWNFVYFIVVEVPVLAYLSIKDLRLEMWFPVLGLPIAGCAACRRLFVLYEWEAQQAATPVTRMNEENLYGRQEQQPARPIMKMNEDNLDRLFVIIFDLAGMVAFGIIAFIIADNGIEKLDVLMVISATVFAVFGLILALGVGCKRPSRGWAIWGIAHMIVVEGPLLFIIHMWELNIRKWFLLLVVPTLGCLVQWWLIELQNLQVRHATITEVVGDVVDDEASSPRAVYSSNTS